MPALNLSDMQVAVSMDTVDHRKFPGSLCSIYVYNRTYLEGHCRSGSIQFGFITEMYLESLKRMGRAGHCLQKKPIGRSRSFKNGSI